MGRQARINGIVKLLRREAERFSHLHFDEETEKMPPLRIECGRQEDFDGDEARYYPIERRIVFSPGFIAACWRDKRRFWDLDKLKDTLLHEMVHSWVDWKGKGSDFAGGHNEWFLWKAHQLGINLEPTRYRWQKIIPIHNEIKLGWNPAYISLDGWRKLFGATKDWHLKSWWSLLFDCQVIEEVEKTVGADVWPKLVAELGHWNPWVSDYEVIKKIKTHPCIYELGEIINTLERSIIDNLERSRPVIYELLDELKRRRVEKWGENVTEWRAIIKIVGNWDNKHISIYQITEELKGLHNSLRNEISEVIKRCKPLRRFITLVKERFDREFYAVDRFVGEVENNCFDEAVYLYSELHHLCFQKPDLETYEFFRQLCIVG